MTRLSVVVPVWNRLDLARACLASLRSALVGLDCESEVVVVDDASEAGVAEALRVEFPEVRLLVHEHNRGFAASANAGLAAARGELLLLLNSDTRVDARDLERLLRFLASEPSYDAVAPRLVDPGGATQESLMGRPTLGAALFHGTPLGRLFPRARALSRYEARGLDHDLDHDGWQAPAAAWLVRRASWERVGPFDEELELFFNDADWFERLRAAGGRMRYLSSARVTHHGGASTALRADFVARWQTDRLRYYRKHHGLVGALWIKAVVSLCFVDWWVANGRRRMLGGTAESSAETARAFAAFLRA